MNTHNLKVDFGRHKGELYTRVPVSYLIWMVQANHNQSEIAKSELDRRGTIVPDIEISGHAINRASLSCRKIWHETKEKDEGLYTWLIRMSKNALEEGNKKNDKYIYKNMKFVFEINGKYKILKTIMRGINEN